MNYVSDRKRYQNMRKVVLVGLLIIILVSGCQMDKNNNIVRGIGNAEETSNSDNDNNTIAGMQEKYRVKWRANMLDGCEADAVPIEKIVYSGDRIHIGASVIWEDESKDSVSLKMLCCLMLDGKLIPFSVEDGNEDEINYITVQNGAEQRVSVEFYPYGLTAQETALIFICIPYYEKMETEDMSENLMMYCKKMIRSDAGDTESLPLEKSENYFITDNTVDTYGKKLYEISSYNGSLKDYVLQDKNGDVYYLGDYQETQGMTYLMVNDEFLKHDQKNFCIDWNNHQGKFINYKIEKSAFLAEKNKVFAITVRSDEVVLAKKSFNTTIEAD